jgi:hypothetical protein
MVLFDLKSGWELNTKKVEYIHIFPMGIYLHLSDQRFRFYNFLHGDGFAENCNSGQTALMREKIILGLFGQDSSLELNTKKLENSPIFLSVTYTASSDQRFRSYGILRIDKTAKNWTGQHNNLKHKILTIKQNWNSRIAEYHPAR